MWPVALLQRLHMVHRAGALVALIVVVAATLVLYRKAQPVGAHYALVLAPAVLVLCQGALGIAVVSTGAPLAIVTAHHATGALLLASLVLAWTTCRSESQGA
jgi:heme A synthase